MTDRASDLRHDVTPKALDRRRFMAYCSAVGLGGVVPATLWAQAQQEGTVT